MESDHLRQLRQQKELILRHLDWINQQIDKETQLGRPSPSPKISRLLEAIPKDKPVSAQLEFKDPEAASQHQVASDIYDQLGPDTKSAAQQTRRGCLMIAGFATCLLGALVCYVYFFY